MDIIEMTRQLGVEIQKTDVYKAYLNAKKANDEDKALQEDIGKFNLIRMQLDQALSVDETADDETKKEEIKNNVNELNKKLKDAYTEIMNNPVMVDYNVAKTELDALVNQINAIISLTLSGEDPLTCDISSGCTGSCESCSGCH